MKKWLISCLVLVFGAMLVETAQATLATNPNQLLPTGTAATFKLTNYENVYDSSGNIVPTTTTAVVGDTLQGVFAITTVQNGAAGYNPDPSTGGNGFEITGVFDEAITGIDSAGNYILMPDTSTVVGSKAMSGATFQSASFYGTGAMVAVFYNTNNNMPVNDTGLGLEHVSSAAAAFSLATTNPGPNPGVEWASFGAKGTWGTGYYWAAQQTGPGVDNFAASLGFIQNLTTLSPSLFLQLTQNPPGATGADPALAVIPNPFVIQGNVNADAGNGGNVTAYNLVSQDPVHMGLVPEPSGILVLGGLFALFGLGAYWRKSKA